MSPHTPGPWERRGLTVFAQGETALSIAVATQHQPEARANAQLIAAAPDLLAALKWFVDDIKGRRTVMVDFDANVVQAQAAIARATGAA